MAATTIIFGFMLIALGLLGYVGSGAASVTALIPAFFGVVLAVLGWVGRNERHRKHAMHAAAAVGLLGFLGSARGLAGLMALVSGGGVERPAAVVAQSLMAVLMAVFVVLCVKSFRDARRARASQGR